MSEQEGGEGCGWREQREAMRNTGSSAVLQTGGCHAQTVTAVPGSLMNSYSNLAASFSMLCWVLFTNSRF